MGWVMGVRGRTWRALRRAVGRAASAAASCKSPLYLDDKEPRERTGDLNLTQWNGRMVMETAFDLHRRSLFIESLASMENVDQNGAEGWCEGQKNTFSSCQQLHRQKTVFINQITIIKVRSKRKLLPEHNCRFYKF